MPQKPSVGRIVLFRMAGHPSAPPELRVAIITRVIPTVPENSEVPDHVNLFVFPDAFEMPQDQFLCDGTRRVVPYSEDAAIAGTWCWPPRV